MTGPVAEHPSRPRRAFAAVLLIDLLLTACSSGPLPTPIPATTSDAQSACLGSQPSAAPGFRQVIELHDGPDSALLFVGPDPKASGLLLLAPCRITWGAAGTIELATGSGGSLGPMVDPRLSLDVAAVDSKPTKDRLMAGRVGPDVTRVWVALADGSALEAVVKQGYWLAWWRSDQKPVRITAFDRSGTEVRRLEDSGGLAPPL